MPSDPFDLGSVDESEAARPAGGIAARAMAASRTEAPYLKTLNREQRRAVENVDGPSLILAGAGTGKTRVLTTRLAHILHTQRAWPGQILAVTFTNKAAREMKERIGAIIGSTVEGMQWLGTFHSIGAKILRRDAELVGLRPDFAILDTDDQIRLLKQLIKADGIDEKRWPARQLAAEIDSWKNRGITPQNVPTGESKTYANGKGIEIYTAYQARLKILNAADFGDLLLECLRLFQENPDVLSGYRQRFKYMLVDEYQDTNVAQYLWLRLLAGNQGNIACVGDDDQSIYGWRGAEVDNILRFEKDFPGALVVRLEENYRSTAHILNAASGLIAHNQGRLGKSLRTAEANGNKVQVKSVWDGEEEARSIADDIETLQRDEHKLNEIAILVRVSSLMREFEDRFVTLNIPYRVIGGPRFYERREVRDALAYLKVTAQPDNDLAFERIINTPKRGLGNVTVQKLHEFARAKGISLTRAARALVETDELSKAARKSLGDLMADFDRWRSLIDGLPHTELAEMILDESGYTAMWQNDKAADAQGRLENLKELVNSMAEFENLAGFLEHISLVMDVQTPETSDMVNLMTLHSAKGLEFDTVFLPGWEEGLFPHQRALDESGREGLEEERRLAYVGITRARKLAKISFVSNRRIHNLWQSAMPSRFLDELPEADVEVASTSDTYGGETFGHSRFNEDVFEANHNTPGWRRAQSYQAANPAPVFEGKVVASGYSETSTNTIGERVFHDKFGYGRIAAIDGNKLTINFEHAGRKRVLDSFVTRH
jgi:ATP-dependent DNA helicase UvrD/PcrA